MRERIRGRAGGRAARSRLLFLDIQMPKLDGFEVLELLDRSPLVVFVTAHDEYALRAFEVHALDYLLKPFSQERFRAVLERVKQHGRPRPHTPVAGLAASLRAKPLQRVVVRGEDGSDPGHPRRARRLRRSRRRRHRHRHRRREAAQAAVDRRPRRASSIPTASSASTAPYLLNIERIEKIELYAKDSRVAILRDGTRLPVSRSGYARLRELL